MSELKPCPFCGGDADVRYGKDVDNHITYSVICNRCGTGIFRAKAAEWEWDAYQSAYEAKKEWNKRKEKDMTCDKCGKEFEAGNRPDGLPNGMSFLMPDGRPVTMCCECLMKEGKEIMDEEEE